MADAYPYVNLSIYLEGPVESNYLDRPSRTLHVCNRDVACKVELVVFLGTDENSPFFFFCFVHFFASSMLSASSLAARSRINTGLVLADYTIGLPGPL